MRIIRDNSGTNPPKISEYNYVADCATAVQGMTVSGLDASVSPKGMALSVPPAVREFRWGKIAAIDGTDKTKVSWTEQQMSGPNEWQDRENGISASFTDNPAYEMSGCPNFAVGDIVQLWRFKSSDGDYKTAWEFIAPKSNTLFPVKVYKTSGDAGDQNAPCTFVYTVKTMTDIEIATELTPERKRPALGAMVAPADGTTGIGYWLKSGDTNPVPEFHLWDANEIEDVEGC